MQFSPQGGNGTVFAPSDVVPVTGIEPVRLSSRDFKSRASANSATPAWWYTLIKYHSAPVLSRQSILETERRKAQNIILENRSRLSVSGVEEVSGFDESIVQMQTELGALTVHGSNLRVETLSVDSGDLLVVGDISDLSYADVPVRRGFWARLFG